MMIVQNIEGSMQAGPHGQRREFIEAAVFPPLPDGRMRVVFFADGKPIYVDMPTDEAVKLANLIIDRSQPGWPLIDVVI
jgi:hypothetical protein